MNALIEAIDAGVEASDYASLAQVFSFGPASWQSLGQGEQRSLAAYFIKSVVASSSFNLQQALTSPPMMNTFLETLAHLPTSPVEGAADNKLRQAIFDYKVNEEGDFAAAARVLSGMRMEDDPQSVYFFTPADKCEVYVKISECFLEEDEIAESDAAVTKAGTVVEGISDPDQYQGLILRYKSTYARVLDANRKFLQAASRYHDLSQSSGDLIQADDLMGMLGRAVTCAILAPSGAQRQRVLAHLFKDPRLRDLDNIPQFETHATILTKMFKNQIIGKNELVKFEASLQEHQKAVMGDGLTIMERGVVEHNMQAVSAIYESIYISELAIKLGVSCEKAERIAASMITDGSLLGSIDQVSGLVEFSSSYNPEASWNTAIGSFCLKLNQIAGALHVD
ncbi:PCI domain containing protein [Nitzschia inconspicua]|uniref:PCI domain containing protein n=1 Tax=Nitzschia inconspicua TaxID=303405 RepID=A0A9K3PPP1_9STRA|nr:PCI domain containing protein [Nitzschia inconspicua]